MAVGDVVEAARPTGGGWFGDVGVVLNYLRTVGADRTAEGDFVIVGEDVAVGMDRSEVVVSAGVVYLINGERRNLAAGLRGGSQGVPVVVI